MSPEKIQAITPLCLAAIGGLIGLSVLISPNLSDARSAAGLGLAGTAIAGASGLAQNAKGDSISIQKDTRSSVQEEP